MAKRRIAGWVRELVLDSRLSDGAVRTVEVAVVMGYGEVVGVTQEDIAAVRGISKWQVNRHFKEARMCAKAQLPINTKGARQKWVPRKRLGDTDIQAELQRNRVDVRVASYLALCARAGRNPFECCGGECYGKITGEGAEYGAEYGAFLCGSPDCFRLLHLAGQEQPLEPIHISELELCGKGLVALVKKGGED